MYKTTIYENMSVRRNKRQNLNPIKKNMTIKPCIKNNQLNYFYLMQLAAIYRPYSFAS